MYGRRMWNPTVLGHIEFNFWPSLVYTVKGKCPIRTQPARDKRWQSANTTDLMLPFFEASPPPSINQITYKLTVEFMGGRGPTLPPLVRGGRQWVQRDNRFAVKDKPKINIAGFSNPKINDGDNGQGGAPKGFGGPDKRRRRWGDLQFFIRCD